MPDKETFALINAILNAIAGVLIVIGFVFIKKKNYRAHGWTMASAVAMGVLFLASYLTSKFIHGEVSSGMPAGWFRFIYLYIVLLPHTIMAAIVLVLVIVAVTFAAKRKWESHRKVARWTLPIWLYVSVTGVLIYFLLYWVYPAMYPEAFKASPLF